MVILALDTVTRAGSVALLDDSVCHARRGDASSTHAERLPLELTEWAAAHGRQLADVSALAVVTGPGSFTGLRIGIAAVQGLSLAGRRPALGVPTLEALASSWNPPSDEPVLVVAVLDGQRGDLFFAAWRREGRQAFDQSIVVIDSRVGTSDEAHAAVAAARRGLPVVVVGDLTPEQASGWCAMASTSVVTTGMTLAEAAARLAASRVERAGTPHALRPLYVRRPDVELARDRAQAAADGLEQFIVRRASGSDDLRAVAALQQATFTQPWSADAIQWELEHTDVARLYVLQAVDGPVVGFCSCWLVFDELHLNSFAIAEAYRRRGLARRLLRQVLEEGRSAGARSSTLEVRASNLAARRLYETLGFSVEGVRRDYYQAPREDALIFWNRRL